MRSIVMTLVAIFALTGCGSPGTDQPSAEETAAARAEARAEARTEAKAEAKAEAAAERAADGRLPKLS